MFVETGIGAVQAQAGALTNMVARLEPDAVPLSEAPGMWQAFDRMERLAGGAKLLLARRVDESGVWQQAGDRDAGVWLARHGGTSITAARVGLSTSKRLAKLPDTAAAVRAGRLSVPQAEPVADAASRDGGAERRLLGMAGEASLSELREECGRVKAAADPDPERTWERIRANRRLRHGTDSDGAWWLSGRGTADDGGELMTVLGPIVDEIFQEAHNNNRAEPREAYMWDALIELARRAHDWVYNTPTTPTATTPTATTPTRIHPTSTRTSPPTPPTTAPNHPPPPTTIAMTLPAPPTTSRHKPAATATMARSSPAAAMRVLGDGAIAHRREHEGRRLDSRWGGRGRGGGDA